MRIRMKYIHAIALSLFMSVVSCASDGMHSNRRDHSFADIKKYEKMLENPERDTWQKPDEVIARMALKNGDVVADIGAGTGYFTRRFAKAIAPDGRVTGFDSEPNMVEYMKNDAKRLGYSNYHAARVEPKQPEITGGAFSVIFMCNTYHHVVDRVPFIKAIARGLKRGGRIIVIDQKMEVKEGPPKRFRIEKKMLISEFAEAGFVPVKDEDFLPGQYYLEFRDKMDSK